MDKKIVGPAFRDVAARYRGDPSAEDQLMQKITRGGAGVWGRIPMPANPHLSASESRQLAVWVMSLSGGAAQPMSAPATDDPKARGRSARVM